MIRLERREDRVGLNPEERQAILDHLRQKGISEAMILATCARTELYGVGIGAESAARHLFRVCSGLDSPVLGETEIVAQVKDAWNHARRYGMLGPNLDRLVRHALRTGKRVRTETDLCRGVVSYAGLAVREASARAGGLANKSVLVIGAGDMGERVLRELRRTPPMRVTVMSRTLPRARALAEKYGHSAEPLGSVCATLEQTDIVFGALSGMVTPLGRFVPNRELVAVDLGEPMCLPCSLTERPNVDSVTLQNIVQRCMSNRARRDAAVLVAEAIIEEELIRYQSEERRRRSV